MKLIKIDTRRYFSFSRVRLVDRHIEHYTLAAGAGAGADDE